MRRAFALCLLVVLVTAAPARAQDPEPEPEPPPPPVIAEGVTVAGVDVGGLTAEDATAAVQAFFDQPIGLTFRKRAWTATPLALGARAQLTVAVAAALAAAPGEAVDLGVRIRLKTLRRYVAAVDRRFQRPARDSRVVLRNVRPRITRARKGVDVRRRLAGRRIARALLAHRRGPLEVPKVVLRPRVTRANFGPVVVIRRESRRLYLYKGSRRRAIFGIATGQPAYPTPLGSFRIVTKQRNPWWYPPNADWAAGASPIPPGPNNPLGTRWMGLSVGGVGIHGTPNPGSIGYAASHGCIRMRIPEAEWLFDRVRLGTPVFIVRA